jgi:hypothetical protein
LIAGSQTRLLCNSILFCELHENSRFPIWTFADAANNFFRNIAQKKEALTHPHPSLVRGATFKITRTSFGVESSWPNTIDEFIGTTCHVNGSDDFLVGRSNESLTKDAWTHPCSNMITIVSLR